MLAIGDLLSPMRRPCCLLAAAAVLLLVALQPQPASALYEDQIGKFDW